MKMKTLLAAAGALCLAVTLGACQLFNPTEGRLNDTMHTMFFDFTVTGAYLAEEYEGYQPAEGNQLLVADITVKNTFRESIEMYDTDFQAQWGEDEDPEAYSIPITTDPETFTELEPVGGYQLPGTYPLAVDEERSGQLVYEVPQGLCGLFPLLSGTLRRRERGGEHRRHLLRLLYSAGRPVKPCQTQNFASPPEAAPSRRPLFLRRLSGHLFLDKGTGV